MSIEQRTRKYEDKRTFIAEDVKHILDQIDKILEIHVELINHLVHPPFIVDSCTMKEEDIRSMMEG